jgi:hypothetical protein
MGRIPQRYRNKMREVKGRIETSALALASVLRAYGYSDQAADDLVYEHLPMLTRLCGAMDWSPSVVTKAMMCYLLDGGSDVCNE